MPSEIQYHTHVGTTRVPSGGRKYRRTKRKYVKKQRKTRRHQTNLRKTRGKRLRNKKTKKARKTRGRKRLGGRYIQRYLPSSNSYQTIVN